MSHNVSKLNYRLAKPGDNRAVARLIVQAMDDLALKFVNSKNSSDAIPVLELFVQQEHNLYSYENVIVCEDDNGIVGSINGYDGARYRDLRQPFLSYIRNQFSFNLQLEDETSEGEFYLDTISVIPGRQGQGIGTSLIKKMIEQAVEHGHNTIGLLVDKTNPKAKKLYEQMGFEWSNDKTFLGGRYDHMIWDARNKVARSKTN